MSQLYSSYPPFWNLVNDRLSESLSKSFSLKLESPRLLSQKVRNLAFQLHDPNSSSSQSTQSNHEFAATGRTNSQDQCISSESGQEDSCGRSAQQQVKPTFFASHPESALNLTQIDYGHSMPSVSYPRIDPCFGGLMPTYGSPPMIQPHMVGMTPARVPLPLINMGEEEPIYVNAKQYHGILRRRQSRAKLEAQNKLIKARKPYLHESRHRHALNRVRGSGGRFLSTKKLQQAVSDSRSNDSCSTPSSGFGQQQSQGSSTVTAAATSSTSSITHLTNRSSVTRQPPDRGPSGISSTHMGAENVLGNGRWMNNPSNQHYAPVVW